MRSAVTVAYVQPRVDSQAVKNDRWNYDNCLLRSDE